MFGNTTRIPSEITAGTVTDPFNELKQEAGERKIVLVGHGIQNEIRIMDQLGFSLETLPVAAIVDAASVAAGLLGSFRSLKHLLMTLCIPARDNLLHCAGNDARYTLQVLLALSQLQYPAHVQRLETLARQDSPLPPSWSKKEESANDWADHLQIDASLPLGDD